MGEVPSAAVQIPTVKIFTLGRFAVEAGAARPHLEIRAGRPLQLLKVLVALGSESVSIGRLTESLWPDSEGDHARKAFNTTLNRLREMVGHDGLLVRAGRLSLNPDRCWVDADHFVTQLAQAAQALQAGDPDGASRSLDDALGLYRGPFLTGEFDPPEILSARARFHAIFLRHVESFGEHYCRSKQPERAIALYRRGLEIDDQSESLYQRLLRCYLEQGRIAEGLALYDRCREILAATAGIAPSAETETLRQSLLRARQEQAPRAASAATPAAESPAPSARPTAQSAPEAGAIGHAAAGGKAAVATAPRSDGSVQDYRVSIAVLPFQNLSGDPEQEYFSDGLTEDLITDLAAFSALRVMARNTVFTYKGKSVTVSQVGQELGVSHVVEGSVRKAGNRMRLTAQLCEAAGGSHLWAGRYDREMTDVFAVQDEIVRAIVTELHVKLLEGEQARSWRKSTNSAQAYDYFLRAMQDRHGLATRQEVELAIGHAKQAVALDPGFAHAHAVLASLYRVAVILGYPPDPRQTLNDAAWSARRAVELDPSIARGHLNLGLIAILRKEFDEGEALLRKAMALEPESSDSMGLVALGLVMLGRHGEALSLADQAIALTPRRPSWMDFVKGLALFHLERFSDALPSLAAACQGGFARHFVVAYTAAAHAALGQDEQARAAVGRLLELWPGFRGEARLQANFFRLEQDRERFRRHFLRATGPG